jgi:hypothetical protein
MAIIPAISSAGDFWSETPDLNHNKKSTFNLNEAIFFNNTSQIGMWAETPDLNSSDKNREADLGTGKISSDELNGELYTETPDLSLLFNQGL